MYVFSFHGDYNLLMTDYKIGVGIYVMRPMVQDLAALGLFE